MQNYSHALPTAGDVAGGTKKDFLGSKNIVSLEAHDYQRYHSFL